MSIFIPLNNLINNNIIVLGGIFLNNTFKILIIIIIILVSILGLVGGFILESHLDSDNKNVIVTNHTNSSVNNVTTNSTIPKPTSSPSALISSQKAINIVKQSVPAYGNIRYGAKLVQNGQNPYYLVSVYENDRNSTVYGEAIGGAKVDAKTGEFLGGMG